MKNKLSKIVAGVVLCLSLIAMPIVFVGCEKEDAPTQDSVLESMNEVVSIGDLHFSLIDWKYSSQSKDLNIELVIENYSESDIQISLDSFMMEFGARGSDSDLISIKSNSISVYEIKLNFDGYQVQRGEHFLFLGNHLIGSLGAFEI